MKVKMRYKFQCSLFFLCIFIICTHPPMTTYAFRSTHSNEFSDDPLYDIELSAPLANKRSLTCDSCGNECTNACGTKNFRTCCFNYLRKRNDPGAIKSISNKRLIDFILLQGRAAMYTLDEHHRSGDRGGGAQGRVGVGDAGIDGDEKTLDANGDGHGIGSTYFHHRML